MVSLSRSSHGEYETEEVSQLELIKRLTQHIPEKHFRMIRYFGFLANRVVGNKLSKVRDALSMETHPPLTPALRYGQMIESFLKVNQFECILCGAQMRF
ncbi:transposase [Vibrio coralliilyticus]|nr:transposase [Vibrio coralliilyticus]